MKGILKKEFYLLQNQLLFIVIAVIGISVLFVFTDMVVMLPNSIGVMAFSFAVSLFNYDETAHSHNYLRSLPNGVKKLVAGRYLFGAILIVTGFLFGFLVSFVLLQNISPEKTIELVETFAGSVLGISVVWFVAFPFIYRFGMGKLYVLFAIIFAVYSGLLALLAFGVADKLFAAMNNLGQLPTYLLIVGLELFFGYLSYRVSVGMELKK